MNKHELILAIVKDEGVAKGVLKTEILTDINYKDILRSMGFMVS